MKGLQAISQKVTTKVKVSEKGALRNSALVISALLLSLTVFPVYSQSSASNEDKVYGSLPNRDLSIQYTRLARQSADSGNYELSGSFLDTALVFWKYNPDALYLQAQNRLRNEEHDRAIDLMATALSGITFQFYNKNEVLLAYLDLLVKFDRSQDVLVLIQSLPWDIQKQKQILHITCRALLTEGRTEQLSKSVHKGNELYPSDSFFQHHLLQIDSGYRHQVQQDILENQNVDFYSKEAFQSLIPATNRPSDIAKLLALYRETWGEDLFSRIQGFRLYEDLGNDELTQLFNGISSITENQLTLLMEISEVLDSVQNVKKAFEEFSGNIKRDPDKDGFYEIEELYSQGVIQKVEENSDGDPDFERTLIFENGTPKQFSLHTDTKNMLTITYDKYPEVSKAKNRTGSSVIEMELVPYSIRYQIPGYASYVPAFSVPLPSQSTVPVLGTLLANSANIDAYKQAVADASEAKRYAFSREEGLLKEIQAQETKVAADMLAGTVNERRRDSDGDGYYEIREYYQDGELVRITYDGNRNGTPEYIEEYKNTPIRMWDTDEDGIIEYQLQFEKRE